MPIENPQPSANTSNNCHHPAHLLPDQELVLIRFVLGQVERQRPRLIVSDMFKDEPESWKYRQFVTQVSTFDESGNGKQGVIPLVVSAAFRGLTLIVVSCIEARQQNRHTSL